MVSAIFAIGNLGEFGTANGGLPFKCRTDMARFKAITLNYGYVIIGRTTFNHIGPLSGRTSIVICRNPEYYRLKERRLNVIWMTLEDALKHFPCAIVIGGASILKTIWPKVTTAYVSHISPKCYIAAEPATVYFEPDLGVFKHIHTELHSDHIFRIYKRV